MGKSCSRKGDFSKYCYSLDLPMVQRICVSASSPISRHTDPKVLVSRTYQGTSFAGPRIEDGKNCTLWIIDIGQDHQGSPDGKTWTNLRVHENDQTMCKPGHNVQTGSVCFVANNRSQCSASLQIL
ncbi:hypothetical protein ACSBR2_039029 [Camellia fascicularis]